MKLMKNKKYLQQNISRLVLVPQTTADFTSRVTEQEDRGSNPGLATWIFIDWLSPAFKSRYGWKIAKSTSILKTTNQPTSRVSKSYAPFTCKFPMVMHFVLIQMFICFSYDKTSLKFCASFRFFLAVFMEQFQKIPYLNYVRRGIQLTPLFLYKMVACVMSVTAIITCINCISHDLACFINLQYLCRLHIALQIAQNDATNGSLFSSCLLQS